jgi:hypothetical protein
MFRKSLCPAEGERAMARNEQLLIKTNGVISDIEW